MITSRGRQKEPSGRRLVDHAKVAADVARLQRPTGALLARLHCGGCGTVIDRLSLDPGVRAVHPTSLLALDDVIGFRSPTTQPPAEAVEFAPTVNDDGVDDPRRFRWTCRRCTAVHVATEPALRLATMAALIEGHGAVHVGGGGWSLVTPSVAAGLPPRYRKSPASDDR